MSALLWKLSAETTDNKPEASKKVNHVVVEIEITEHEYMVLDSDDEMVGSESFVFNGDDSPGFIRVTVDGNEIEFDGDDLQDRSKYSDYEPFDMEEKWDSEDIVKFGYYDNLAGKTWEFDVEDFDIEKLSFYYQCFDVKFGPADYDCEEHRITLCYDSEEIQEDFDAYNCDYGEFEQEWSRFDNDDEDTDIEAAFNEKYDQVFMDGDIFSVQLNEKWGIVDADGNELISPRYDWMGDEFVEDVIIVGINGVGIGFVNSEGVEIVAPKYSQAQDFENGFASVCYDGKWGFIDKTGKEVIPTIYDDVNNFEDGKAEVTLNGETFFVDTEGNKLGKTTAEQFSTPNESLNDTDALWAAVISRLPIELQTNVSAPAGKSYFHIKPQGKVLGIKDFKYCVVYSSRASEACVNVESLNGGEEAKNTIQQFIDARGENILSNVEAQQGVKNKNKWSWAVTTHANEFNEELVQWYVDTINAIYELFETPVEIHPEVCSDVDEDGQIMLIEKMCDSFIVETDDEVYYDAENADDDEKERFINNIKAQMIEEEVEVFESLIWKSAEEFTEYLDNAPDEFNLAQMIVAAAYCTRNYIEIDEDTCMYEDEQQYYFNDCMDFHYEIEIDIDLG